MEKIMVRVNQERIFSVLYRIVSLPFALLYFFLSFFQLVVLLGLPKKTLFTIYRGLEAKEQSQRIENMKSYLSSGDRCLDVGSGAGRFGNTVATALNVQVVGVDVVNYADSTIPVHIYDGKTLPFDDNSFDVIFVAFVLHHIKNQEQMMAEMVRCARKKIVVFEDTYDTFWQRLFVMWNDYQTNILQGYVKVIKGYAKKGVTEMPMALTFRSVREWQQFFNGFSVELISTALRHSGYKPLQKVTFLLQVCR
jgi:SAM-dependent methyltransferase